MTVAPSLDRPKTAEAQRKRAYVLLNVVLRQQQQQSSVPRAPTPPPPLPTDEQRAQLVADLKDARFDAKLGETPEEQQSGRDRARKLEETQQQWEALEAAHAAYAEAHGDAAAAEASAEPADMLNLTINTADGKVVLPLSPTPSPNASPVGRRPPRRPHPPPPPRRRLQPLIRSSRR